MPNLSANQVTQLSRKKLTGEKAKQWADSLRRGNGEVVSELTWQERWGIQGGRMGMGYGGGIFSYGSYGPD